MAHLNNLEDLALVVDRFEDINEPFDPAYLTNKAYEVPDISSYERAFYRKMNIVINKLRKNRIRFEWLDDEEVFRVHKYRTDKRGVKSDYPTYMYIAIYDNKEYSFGGEQEDMIVSTHIGEVIEKVVEWLNNNEPATR